MGVIAGYFVFLLHGNEGEAYNVCSANEYVSIAGLVNKLLLLYPEYELKLVRKKRNINEHYTENILLKDIVAISITEKLEMLGRKPIVSIEIGFKRVIDYISI